MSALNIGQRLFVDDVGAVYPITDFLNADGEACEEGDDIVSIVAGAGDRWYAIDPTAFDGEPS